MQQISWMKRWKEIISCMVRPHQFILLFLGISGSIFSGNQKKKLPTCERTSADIHLDLSVSWRAEKFKTESKIAMNAHKYLTRSIKCVCVTCKFSYRKFIIELCISPRSHQDWRQNNFNWLFLKNLTFRTNLALHFTVCAYIAINNHCRVINSRIRYFWKHMTVYFTCDIWTLWLVYREHETAWPLWFQSVRANLISKNIACHVQQLYI